MDGSTLSVILGLTLPLTGTTLGAAMVFFMRRDLGDRTQKALMGFASGIMIAASVWSLLIPAIDMARELGQSEWLPAVGGFLTGVGFLLILDMAIPHLHMYADNPEGPPVRWRRTLMLTLAVTLHNLPEGMAVGAALAGALSGSAAMPVAGAFALALGIAIQNFPEGAIISMPLRAEGMTKSRSFLCGFASGTVEPIGADLMLLLTSALSSALPFILSFAAGAMIYVVIEELIPAAQSDPHSNAGTIGAALGFALMMALDVML